MPAGLADDDRVGRLAEARQDEPLAGGEARPSAERLPTNVAPVTLVALLLPFSTRKPLVELLSVTTNV